MGKDSKTSDNEQSDKAGTKEGTYSVTAISKIGEEVHLGFSDGRCALSLHPHSPPDVCFMSLSFMESCKLHLESNQEVVFWRFLKAPRRHRWVVLRGCYKRGFMARAS